MSKRDFATAAIGFLCPTIQFCTVDGLAPISAASSLYVQRRRSSSSRISEISIRRFVFSETMLRPNPENNSAVPCQRQGQDIILVLRQPDRDSLESFSSAQADWHRASGLADTLTGEPMYKISPKLMSNINLHQCRVMFFNAISLSTLFFQLVKVIQFKGRLAAACLGPFAVTNAMIVP